MDFMYIYVYITTDNWLISRRLLFFRFFLFLFHQSSVKCHKQTLPCSKSASNGPESCLKTSPSTCLQHPPPSKLNYSVSLELHPCVKRYWSRAVCWRTIPTGLPWNWNRDKYWWWWVRLMRRRWRNRRRRLRSLRTCPLHKLMWPRLFPQVCKTSETPATWTLLYSVFNR